MLHTTFVAQAAPTPVVVAPTKSYPVRVRVWTPPISTVPEPTAGSPPTVVAWSRYRDVPERAYRIATVVPVQSLVPEESAAVIVTADEERLESVQAARSSRDISVRATLGVDPGRAHEVGLLALLLEGDDPRHDETEQRDHHEQFRKREAAVVGHRSAIIMFSWIDWGALTATPPIPWSGVKVTWTVTSRMAVSATPHSATVQV